MAAVVHAACGRSAIEARLIVPAGGAARRAGRARRAAADAHGRPRRPSAARSSIATAGCSPTASTPTPSTPCRPRSPTPPKTAAALCGALDDCTQEDARGAARAARAAIARSSTCERRATPTQAQARRRARARGIGFMKESRRFYPNRELAAHVLGYVGIDNVGLERARSRPTTRRCAAARARCWCRPTRGATCSAASSGRRPAGGSLELTIDEQLQHIAEREAARRRRGSARRRRHRGDHGSAHRRDPRDGELADVQPERLRRRAGAGAPQSRRAGHLRAGLDVQDRHRIGGARGARDDARRR